MKSKKTSRPKPLQISRQKRLLLKSMELNAWVKNFNGCLKFLSNLHNLRSDEQEGWVTGNKKYYLRRLTALCDNAPNGTESLVADAKKFLATI